MPKPIQVSLNTKGNPYVTVDVIDLDMPREIETIHWVRAQNQNFDFVDVWIDDSNAAPGTFPFKEVSDGMVTVRDKNTKAADCPYVITVISNGTVYDSQRRSRNKPKKPIGGGSPTIHNR